MAHQTEFTTSGFLQEPAYTADLSAFLDEHAERFAGLWHLTVDLKELSWQEIARPREKSITISDDGRKCLVRFTTHKQYNNKGKVLSTPTPADVLRALGFMIGRAAREYAEKFPGAIPENR
ncbi:MAG TPA: hypothetical protein VKG92_12135 [Flavobacteriales bacterium]|nr:hypothetical protein [Flavobacteriales bacterium]